MRFNQHYDYREKNKSFGDKEKHDRRLRLEAYIEAKKLREQDEIDQEWEDLWKMTE